MTVPSVTTTVPARNAVVIVGSGCAALMARPLLAHLAVDQTAALLFLFALLLGVGAYWPVHRTLAPRRVLSPTVAVSVGVAAFLVGRLAAGAHSAGPFTARFVLLNAFAAVAEEAFFRRLVFAVLEPYGAAYAVAGSALLFAVVHVTVYGPWVLPVDLAAGLVFGWQRSATGSWAPPAVTHVVANVLAVL